MDKTDDCRIIEMDTWRRSASAREADLASISAMVADGLAELMPRREERASAQVFALDEQRSLRRREHDADDPGIGPFGRG